MKHFNNHLNSKTFQEKQKPQKESPGIRSHFGALVLGIMLATGQPDTKASQQIPAPTQSIKEGEGNIHILTQKQKFEFIRQFLTDLDTLTNTDDDPRKQRAIEQLKKEIGFEKLSFKYQKDPKTYILDIKIGETDLNDPTLTPEDHEDIVQIVKIYENLQIREKLMHLLQMYNISPDGQKDKTSKPNNFDTILQLLQKDKNQLDNGEKYTISDAYFNLLNDLLFNHIAQALDTDAQKKLYEIIGNEKLKPNDRIAQVEKLFEARGMLFFLNTEIQRITLNIPEKVETFTFKDKLPSDTYIEKLLQLHSNIKTGKVIYANEPRILSTGQQDTGQTNILIFVNNIEESDKEREEIIESMIRNEAMHVFLSQIGFEGSLHTKTIEYNGEKQPNLYIHEVLSDYSSLVTKDKNEYIRIIGNIIYASVIQDSLPESYKLTISVHKKMIEDFLGKPLSVIINENMQEELNTLAELQQNDPNNPRREELLQLLSQKIEKLKKDIYQALESKTIIYNGKEISGVDYIFQRNQEEGQKIMEKIYEWDEQNKQKTR